MSTVLKRKAEGSGVGTDENEVPNVAKVTRSRVNSGLPRFQKHVVEVDSNGNMAANKKEVAVEEDKEFALASSSSSSALDTKRKQAEKTPSKLMGYLQAPNSRSVSGIPISTGDDASTPGSSQGLRRRTRTQAKTPLVEKLQKIFGEKITVDEEQVRAITSQLHRTAKTMKFDFKNRINLQQEAVKALQNLLIKLIGTTSIFQKFTKKTNPGVDL